VRQRVDQVAASQEQIARDIAKLAATAQGILDKISAPPRRPAGATGRVAPESAIARSVHAHISAVSAAFSTTPTAAVS
jgi:hypothetical protein